MHAPGRTINARWDWRPRAAKLIALPLAPLLSVGRGYADASGIRADDGCDPTSRSDAEGHRNREETFGHIWIGTGARHRLGVMIANPDRAPRAPPNLLNGVKRATD